jgi:hypothetical protein
MTCIGARHQGRESRICTAPDRSWNRAGKGRREQLELVFVRARGGTAPTGRWARHSCSSLRARSAHEQHLWRQNRARCSRAQSWSAIPCVSFWNPCSFLRSPIAPLPSTPKADASKADTPKADTPKADTPKVVDVSGPGQEREDARSARKWSEQRWCRAMSWPVARTPLKRATWPIRCFPIRSSGAV